jgi:hypothetical protein
VAYHENVWGSTLVVFGIGAGDSPHGARLYRLERGRATVIWKGSAYLSSLNRGVAYLNAGELAARLVRVDLRTGRVTRIAWLPRSPRLVPDSTGRRLAGVAYRLAERSRLVPVQLGKAVAVRSVALDAPEELGDVHWLPDGRLLLLPSGGDSARVLDGSVRTRTRFRWTAGSGARVGSTVFGVDRRGRLVSAKLPAGPQRVVRQLPGGDRAPVIVSAAR